MHISYEIALQSGEELNLGPLNTNTSSGREQDLNPGPADYMQVQRPGHAASTNNNTTMIPFFFRQVYNNFGAVTSFTGTYKADEWTLVLSSSQGPSISPFHGTINP